MKKSTSNLQTTIVLASVLSAALLFSVVVLSFNGYHTQIADAKKSHRQNVSSSSISGDTTPDNTAATTTATTSSAAQQQQQQPMNGAIQLSAKELPSGYRWVDTTNGVINPTMNFNAGTNKTIQVQNPTDSKHQLIIEDSNGNQLASSGDVLSGSSSLVSFKPGMTGVFQYHCLYHPTTMKGIIQVP
jgi:plastocyanin